MSVKNPRREDGAWGTRARRFSRSPVVHPAENGRGCHMRRFCAWGFWFVPCRRD